MLSWMLSWMRNQGSGWQVTAFITDWGMCNLQSGLLHLTGWQPRAVDRAGLAKDGWETSRHRRLPPPALTRRRPAAAAGGASGPP